MTGEGNDRASPRTGVIPCCLEYCHAGIQTSGPVPFQKHSRDPDESGMQGRHNTAMAQVWRVAGDDRTCREPSVTASDAIGPYVVDGKRIEYRCRVGYDMISAITVSLSLFRSGGDEDYSYWLSAQSYSCALYCPWNTADLVIPCPSTLVPLYFILGLCGRRTQLIIRPHRARYELTLTPKLTLRDSSRRCRLFQVHSD